MAFILLKMDKFDILYKYNVYNLLSKISEMTTKYNQNITNEQLLNMANAIRVLSMDAIQKANSGHPGMPMGMADVSTVLFTKFFKFSPSNPNWHDRDRFILSAGHGSMLQYSLQYLTGLGNFCVSLDDIKDFRKIDSLTAGHPEFKHTPGIETTTGPLGQGIANSVGFALAEKILNEKYGNDISNHKTYVICGDGCLMEGISQEAITLAAHLKLNNLIVLWDDNNISIDGKLDVATSECQITRFNAAGWETFKCDGHDFSDIEKAIASAQNSDKPVIIACKTIIGKGSPNKQGSASCHGSPLGDDEIKIFKQNNNLENTPFHIDEEILNLWRKSSQKCDDEYNASMVNLKNSPLHDKFIEQYNCDLPNEYENLLHNYKQKLVSEDKVYASRKSSQEFITNVAQHIPSIIGGSADLTGSNLTKGSEMVSIDSSNYNGNYVHYGVREHAMAAIMNGLKLHGGFIPFGGTFLVFADYCKPAIRLSALMEQKVIYIMTHDSIGLGEDGPTHQPIEHLASLRSIPNLLVMRPSDAYETAECWDIALKQKNRPSLIALSRQNINNIRHNVDTQNKSSFGGYFVKQYDDYKTTIIATGSEVDIAISAHDKLLQEGIKVNVVTMPCIELFLEQDEKYINEILGSMPKIIIEAATSHSWIDIKNRNDIFIGMKGFGASGKIEDLYNKFGITCDNVIKNIKNLIG